MLNQGNYTFFVQKDLSDWFAVEYGDFSSMIGAFFDQKTPDQAIVYEALIGDLGDVAVFDGEISYDESKQSYRKSTEEVEYALGVKVTKKLRRNDMYGIVREQVQGLARRFRAKRESLGSSIFNGAFSTTTVADTLSLCNTAHTSDVGGSNQSNSGTSAFSPANVEATRRLMIQFKTNRDNIQAATFPDMLLVPTNLEEQAYELIKSKGKVDTAINNPNFHEGKYKLAVWHNWLTDQTNWFMINQRQMKRFLRWYDWNPVEFFFAGEMDTLVSKHAGYMSSNVSAVNWPFVYGHNAS
ncbi:MAG: hypothetical protein QME60_01315 [Verrucomicrobiota bacterium]|nr:hypothetical protein [Verrucomicrobiota bacterium]